MGKQLQHYVPRFYLEGFADPENPNCVWVYEKGVDSGRLQPIPVTAAEHDFYAPDPPPVDQPKSTIETDVLGRIESNAAYILKRWRDESTCEMTDIERERIALFLACLHARSPMLRRDATELLTVQAKEELAARADDSVYVETFLRSCTGSGVSKEALREALRTVNEPGGVTVAPTQNLVLGMTLLMMYEALPFFLERHYALLKAPGDAEFITSDSPLSVFAPTSKTTALFNVGVGLPWSEITLPLSPTIALRLTNSGNEASRRVSRKIVTEANKRCACQAERFVYAARKSKRIAGLVNSFAFTRDQPRIDPSAIRARLRSRLPGTIGEL